jgi:DNA-binding MarR family transcriptional regulator
MTFSLVFEYNSPRIINQSELMSTGTSVDFGVLLNLAFGAFKGTLHDYLADQGFDDLGPSFGYVFRLLDAAPQNLRQLADALDITPQGALKIVNDMVDKGYVIRRDDVQDARSKQLLLTARATKAMAAARRFHAKFERDLASRIGEKHAIAARLAMEDIARHYGQQVNLKLRPL